MESCELLTSARRFVDEVREFDPRGADPAIAREMLAILSALERLVSARKMATAALLTKETCGERTIAVALARTAGIPVGQAKAELRRIQLIGAVGEVGDAVFAGELSPFVGGVIAGAAKHDAGCVGELSRIAREESLEALQDEVRRMARRREREETVRNREARAHAGRRCWIGPAESGGMRLAATLSAKEGIKLKAAIEDVAKGLSSEAARAGHHEEFAVHMADALCRLVLEGGSKVEAHVFVHASAGALKSGSVGPGEYCEVEGVGQISLALAREYMGEGFVTLLVEEGTDVVSIARKGRYLTQGLIDALMARDRRCVVPGCGSTFGLEFHHYKIPFRHGGRASLENLCRLCGFHHGLTEQGFAITGGPGAWEWRGPPSD